MRSGSAPNTSWQARAHLWTGTVGLTEHLGSDTFLHVHDTGIADTVTVRADGDAPYGPGDRIGLTPDPARIHRFDDRGNRT